ncbi:MAG: WYL domain-containing protein [Clostridia bacterium]|nr:WYL domain-containing protein [Clostridia bacterium]
MSYQEKINIYVPHEIGLKLRSDAMLFEILKKDRRTINLNRFLTMVLCGYYDEYCRENNETRDSLLRILKERSISDRKAESIAEDVMNRVILPPIAKRKGKKPDHLSLKPTSDTERIINAVQAQLKEEDYLSQYFCRMLVSYCQKSISERERIVFRDSYDLLLVACKEQRAITFSLKGGNQGAIEAIPYTVTNGPEEMFNYLLCESLNVKENRYEAYSFRLNRIEHLSFGKTTRKISDEVRSRCERMQKIAPQYAINEDEIICVRLNDLGEDLYNRIYYGRPPYDHIEDDGEMHYYFFRCSAMQVIRYFLRFGGASAVVISPDWVKERMIRFFKTALAAYEQ